jgi:hypothetical protein
MYAVSEKYKHAMNSYNRTSSIYGTLPTVNGTVYHLNDTNIIKDSFYITNQIVNENKLCFGAVYAGECGLVINSDVDRYSLFGAEIEMNIIVNDESIPLGIFYVDTSERIGSKIKLTAIDKMSNFDVSLEASTNGSWYELLSYISNKCGVELAQSQEELVQMHHNVTVQSYTLSRDRIDTYRDALSCLCIVICANATIDRKGKLKIVQYATKPCDSNDVDTRLNNCKFSDYKANYIGIKARFFKSENYYPYSVVEEDASGLVLDVGDVPIVGGTAESKNNTLHAMLETLKQIEYVPSTLYIAPNPAYDLGDLIECKNVNNSSHSVKTYIMSYKYDYRKKETINCYGDNPLLQNVKSKTEKQSSSIENQMALSSMTILNYTNADRYVTRQDAIVITNLNFSVQGECSPLFISTIPFSLDVDGIVEFTLYNGLNEMQDAVYRGYYSKGEHFATLVYSFEMEANSRMEFNMRVKCYADLSSATRIQDAKLNMIVDAINNSATVDLSNISVDITAPTLTIEKFAVKSIIYTQGINAGLSTWDGTLSFKDAFGDIALTKVNVLPFNESVSIRKITPTKSGFVEVINSVSLTRVSVAGFNDSCELADD